MRIKRALVCAPTMPEYDREAGARHVFHVLNFLRAAGWAVSFIAHDATGGERYARILQQLGVATYAGPPTRWAGDAYLIHPERLIAAGQFDLAILWSWRTAEYYLPLLRTHAPQTRVIVDSGDVHFLREARGLLRKPAPDQPAGMLDRGFGHLLRRELNIYAAADGVITVSQKEADLIADFTANPTLGYAVPDYEDIEVSSLPFAARRGMLFVGGFLFPPNIDALHHLCHNILPQLDSAVLAEHPAYIVGYELQNALRNLAQPPANVHMVGWVPVIEPYLQQARIALVPIRYGAGTKRKLIQSLMAGTPSVATRAGAEGLNLRDGEHILIADEPAAFAEAIIRLLYDPDLWQRLATQGRAHVMAVHGHAAVRDRLMEVIADVLAKPRDLAASPVTRRQIVRRQINRLDTLWRAEGLSAVRRRIWLRLQRLFSLD